MNTLMFWAVIAATFAIAFAAAWHTFNNSSPLGRDATDVERSDALERFKAWNEFWKYFLVSFALVLITSLISDGVKQRELALQASKQEADLGLEKAKQASADLLAENTSLGSFLDKALSDDWRKQYQFASYFGHVTKDPEARKRWEDYATFITEKREEIAQLEKESDKQAAEIAQLVNNHAKNEIVADLRGKLAELDAKVDLNKALLGITPTRVPWYEMSGSGEKPYGPNEGLALVSETDVERDPDIAKMFSAKEPPLRVGLASRLIRDADYLAIPRQWRGKLKGRWVTIANPRSNKTVRALAVDIFPDKEGAVVAISFGAIHHLELSPDDKVDISF